MGNANPRTPSCFQSASHKDLSISAVHSARRFADTLILCMCEVSILIKRLDRVCFFSPASGFMDDQIGQLRYLNNYYMDYHDINGPRRVIRINMLTFFVFIEMFLLFLLNINTVCYLHSCPLQDWL